MMSDELVEKVARAIYNDDENFDCFPEEWRERELYRSARRAIDATGLTQQVKTLTAALNEAVTALDWSLGIAAGCVEMGNPHYEQAGAAYERLAALKETNHAG
jgi:hypothetical protein